MLAQQGEAVVKYSLDGRLLPRRGSKTYAFAPHGYYPCLGEDQWIAISVPDDNGWQALRAALADPDWMMDERFATNIGRLASQDEIDHLLSIETVSHEKVALSERLAEEGVDAAPVLDFAEMRDHPQVVARQAFELVDHPIAGLRLLPRLPLTVDGRVVLTSRHAPLFGQDNEEILTALLGLSNESLDELRATFTIGNRPVEVPTQ